MLEFIILVMTLALFLYAFLAGADFGAGILQLLPLGISREERSEFIGLAMGPVWEANHIWLILALVISFNGFPEIFWFISEFFHFPLGALVIGIIFRGASFTFMHYDPIQDKSEKYYHWIFGLSSIWCTMWVGIIIGDLMLGNFALTDTDMYDRYFSHWLNPFAFMMGIFITTMMMFNASLFLYLEAKDNREQWLKVTTRVLVLMIVSGFITHVFFYLQNPDRWKIFFYNPLSIGLIVLSFFLLFPQYQLIRLGYRKLSRMLAGAQLMAIMAAGFVPLYPKVILFRDNSFYDLSAMAAPEPVLRMLTIALATGCVLILPGYFYLLRIFKSATTRT
ncbi:MAG TPA: cytochrome d ubiquinol oxidase subunit II [Bacteriovoracaceae bacterium]|nr:cytochrome d ubiquinol oxidase subunit II [Bacteriovoracaceae bacterium]